MELHSDKTLWSLPHHMHNRCGALHEARNHTARNHRGFELVEPPDQLAAEIETQSVHSQARTAARDRQGLGAALLYASVGSTGATSGWRISPAQQSCSQTAESVPYLGPISVERLPEPTLLQSVRSVSQREGLGVALQRTTQSVSRVQQLLRDTASGESALGSTQWHRDKPAFWGERGTRDCQNPRQRTPGSPRRWQPATALPVSVR